jgi:hypothetical protein
MNNFESLALSPVKFICRPFALALLITLSFSSFVLGSQNSPTPKKKTPSLTTEDLVRPKTDQTLEEGEEKG